MEKKNKVGRPPLYQDYNKLNKAIDEYFESLFRPVIVFNKKDKTNEVLINPKTNEPYMEQFKPATINGLVRALGFRSRQSLLDYSEKDDNFMDAIMRAKQRVEEYAEERLYDKDGCNGAKFTLINNFGWKERQEVEYTGDINITTDKNAEEWGK
jgi:hypothetical protein